MDAKVSLKVIPCKNGKLGKMRSPWITKLQPCIYYFKINYTIFTRNDS